MEISLKGVPPKKGSKMPIFGPKNGTFCFGNLDDRAHFLPRACWERAGVPPPARDKPFWGQKWPRLNQNHRPPVLGRSIFLAPPSTAGPFLYAIEDSLGRKCQKKPLFGHFWGSRAVPANRKEKLRFFQGSSSINDFPMGPCLGGGGVQKKCIFLHFFAFFSLFNSGGWTPPIQGFCGLGGPPQLQKSATGSRQLTLPGCSAMPSSLN